MGGYGWIKGVVIEGKDVEERGVIHYSPVGQWELQKLPVKTGTKYLGDSHPPDGSSILDQEIHGFGVCDREDLCRWVGSVIKQEACCLQLTRCQCGCEGRMRRVACIIPGKEIERGNEIYISSRCDEMPQGFNLPT